MIDSVSQKEIRDHCLRILSRREHSQQELLAKLSLKGFDRSESLLMVEQLAEQGWQSDDRFAESYTRFRIKKGFGPIKIKHELQQRGIDDFDLNAVVSELADSWTEVIAGVYEKKFSENRLLVDKEWQKRYRFLQQRGFSSDLIQMLIKQLGIQIIYSR